MSPRLAVIALLSYSLLCGAGCYTLRADVPGALRSDLADEQVIVTGRIDVELTRYYWLWGLIPAEDGTELGAAMREAVERSSADGVANLVFEARFTPVDYLISIVTLGLASPRTYRVRGDLVRIEATPLPGRPLLSPRRERMRHRPQPLPTGGT